MDQSRNLAGQAALATAVLLVLPCLVLAPFLWSGWMMTHSGSLNASWLEGFAAELAKGRLYPRYLPDMNDGLGSPVFYFYAPLPFFLSSPWVWLTHSADVAVVLGSALLTGLSGIAAHALFRDHADARPSFAAALLYSFLPYHFATDVMIRGAFGETAAFIFVPLALRFILRLERGPGAAAGLALSLAGLLLSHLPTTLASLPVLGLFGLAMMIRTRSISATLWGLAAAACGASLAAIYILPAFSGQSFIRPEFWNAFAPESDTFWRFRNGGDYLLLAQGIGLGLAAVLALASLWRRGARGVLWPIALVLAGLVILATPLGQPLWPHLGFFRRVQFSWRLFALLDLMTCWLLAMELSRGVAAARTRLAALAALSTLAIAAVQQQALVATPGRPTLFEPPLETYASERAVRADAFEYVPPCVAITSDLYGFMTANEKLIRKLQGAEPSGERIRLFYYPFLRVTADGTEVAAFCEPATGLIAAPGLAGRPPTITPVPLPTEHPGWIVTAAGAAGIVLMLVLAITRRRTPLRAN